MIDDLNFDEMPLMNKSHDFTAMKGVKFNDKNGGCATQ